jgi:hypothetical protein
MKAYEAAKLLKMSNKDFLKEYDIKSHMSNIPTELEAELFGVEKKIQTGQAGTETVDRAETTVVTVDTEVVTTAEEVVTEKCPVDIATIRAGINGCGNKSCYWKWRHLA